MIVCVPRNLTDGLTKCLQDPQRGLVPALIATEWTEQDALLLIPGWYEEEKANKYIILLGQLKFAIILAAEQVKDISTMVLQLPSISEPYQLVVTDGVKINGAYEIEVTPIV